MSRGLQYFIFLLAWLLVLTAIDVSGQGREGSGDDKYLPPILFGLDGTIDDLNNEYCSDFGSIDVYANDGDLNADTDEFLWYVYTFVGGTIQWQDDWFSSIGTKPNNGISIDPSLMDGYYGKTIYVEYRPVVNGELKPAVTDRIYVYKTANTTYAFGPDLNVCHNSPSQDLVLENSEDGYDYYLYKDGIQQSGMVPEGSDGTPIHFTINFDEVGSFEYTVEAKRRENSGGLECPVFMDESAQVTVNPLPNVTASSPDPDICEGETIFLEGGPDGMDTYYWEGPNGFTSTLQNPEIPDASTAYSGTYTLTVNDANSCENSTTVDITVYDNPTASPGNDGPVCEGGSLTVNANPSGGSGNYTFSWTKTGDASFSESTESFTFDPAALGDAGEYNVMVTDDNGCQLSTTESTVVEVNENPVVNSVSNDGPVCEGGTLTLSADVSGGSGVYSYNWTGPDGFSSTEESPVISNITLAQAGDYDLTVTDDSGCFSNTETTSVTVNSLPSPVASNDGPKCEGSDIQLTGDPDGMNDYSWSGPNGYTSDIRDPLLTSVDLSEAGDYTLTVTDVNGCQNSNVTTVGVDELPSVELNNDGPVCEDAPVTLEATVTGGTGNYSYVWEKDGTEISGVTTSSYTINNASLSDAGTYEVFVTDESSTCSTVSATSELVVNENPQIDDVTNDGPVCEGGDVQLSVTASGGSGNYSFSWTGPEGFTSTQQNPLISGISLAEAGDYEVVVTDDNGCSSATGTTTVDVNENPDATATNDGPVCAGSDVNVSVSATGGSGSFSYGWYKDGTQISETTSSFTITSADVSDAGIYEVEVSDDVTGCTTTDQTDVVVNENPTVSLNGDLEVCEGNDATFSATASGGDGNYVYTWYYEGTQISGASGATYTVTGATTSDAGQYDVVITDGNGCVSNTASAQLTVNENPSVEINSGATETDVCFGDNLVLDANATGGSGSYSYEWVLPDNSTQTGQQLTVNNVDTSHDGIYTVTVTDASGCSATDDIQVNVVEVNATISASASTICVGDEVTFTADGGAQYEFFHYDQSGGSWTSVQGPGTDNEWTYNSFEDGDLVYANVENSLGCDANSDTIEMTVYDNPTVDLTFPSGSNETCDGVDFTVEATSGYSNYIFYINGTEVQNSTDNTYTSNAFNDGDDIYVTASSGSGCTADSDPKTITVHPLPSAEANNSGPVCEGFDITLQGGPDGMAAYEWFDPNGNSISTSQNYDLTGVALSDAGTYTLVVTDGNGCQNSQTTDVVVHEVPAVDLGSDIVACENTDVTFNASVTGGTSPYSFTWEKDGSVISGVSTSSYTINNVEQDNEGLYVVHVTDDNGCVSVRDTAELTINETPVVNFDATNSENEVCEEESIILETSTSGGDGNYTYEWFHDGDLIPGVSTATYTINNSTLSDAGTYEVVAIDGNGSGCESASDAINVIVHQLPDATLDVDPENFIEGQTVELIGGGGDEFAFFVNGDEKQARSTDNIFETSQLQDGDSVSVQVYSSFGCRADAYQIVTVYDDIVPPEVEITDSTYCEGNPGATFEVTNKITDVTYEIVDVDENPTSYDPIQYDGSNTVLWNDVIDVNDHNGTTYFVKAYWADVPDDYQLSDSLFVREYAAPAKDTMTVNGDLIVGDSTVTSCEDYEIGLENSWGSDTYVLMINGVPEDTIQGGFNPPVFGNYSKVGTYTIVGYNDHCQTQMEGNFTIDVNDLQTFDLEADNDGKYCEGGDGVNLWLEGSESGVEYVLYRDDMAVDTLNGDGDILEFGRFTQEGRYEVEAESGGCIYPMNNPITVEIVSSPDPGTLIATDEGHYCEGDNGVEFTLEVSQEDGVLYELIDVDTGDVLDDSLGVDGGGDIQFNNNESPYFETETTYSVRTTVDPGCDAYSNEVEVVADPLPVTYDVEIFEEKCGAGGLALIGISESESDVEYRWVKGSDDSSWQKGDGGSVAFQVSETGTYSIEARRVNTLTQCTSTMGDIEIVERTLPDTTLNVYEEGGNNCDDGVVVGIESPEAESIYRLFKYDLSGQPVYTDTIETNSSPADSIEFDAVVDTAATYKIQVSTLYGCTDTLNQEIPVDIPGAIERFALKPEEGDICNGDAGFVFELESSESGVDYVLTRAGTTDEVIDTVSGTGGLIEFPPLLEEGVYYVMGLSPHDEACNNEMLNRSELIVRPLPESFNMIGPGVYCDGDSAHLGVDNSQDGMTYILQRHTNEGKRIVDEIETQVPGDTIRFNPVIEENTYSVVAISEYGCTSSMKDTIKVEQMPSPDAPVFSDDTMYYCSVDGALQTLSPDIAQDGVTYRVYDSSDEVVNEVVAESETVNLGPLFEGSYFVRASYDGACSTSAADSVHVIESVMPVVGTPDFDSKVCNGEEATIKYDISDDEESWEWNYSLLDASETALQEQDSIVRNDSIIWFVEASQGEEFYIQIEGPGGVCDAALTGRINISFSAPLDVPELHSNNVKYCPEDNYGSILVQGTNNNNDLAYYLFESGNDAFDQSIDRVFSSDSTYFEQPEGEYVVRSRNIESGCYSDVSDPVVVEEHPKPSVFSLNELYGDQWNDTIFMTVDSVALTPDSLALLEDHVEYYFYDKNSGDESFDLGSDGEVIIDTAGNYTLYGVIEGSGCLPQPMDSTLTILTKELIAVDDSLYLSDEENSDSINVSENDLLSDIDIVMDYSFATGGDDEYTYTSLAGDFIIQPNGLVKFNKAPSFYGEEEVNYIVENKDHPGRKDSATIYVYVGNKNLENDKSIFIPNAFSPNDDQRNDVFKISMDRRSSAEESTLEIYNRWGTLVYRSDGKTYDNSWDGTANVSSMVSIGDDLPNGVYFYVYTIRANVDGKIVDKKFNGYVELRR